MSSDSGRAPVAGYEYGPDATQRATEEALTRAADADCLVLVEGITDQIAVETAARRLGRDLDYERTVVVPIGGAHAIKHFVPQFVDTGVRLRGLVDHAEAPYFAEALGVAIDELADRGFHVCDPDLEAELIRVVDRAAIEALLDANGDLRSFRTMQKQPNWRGRRFDEQMHRWLRSVSNRGPRYAQALVEAADDDVPPPLRAVLG